MQFDIVETQLDGPTRSKAQSFMDALKMHLVDVENITVLDDMTGPTGMNFIYGGKRLFVAKSEYFDIDWSINNPSEDFWAEARRIARVIKQRQISAVAFYELRTCYAINPETEKKSVSTIIRYAALRVISD